MQRTSYLLERQSRAIGDYVVKDNSASRTLPHGSHAASIAPKLRDMLPNPIHSHAGVMEADIRRDIAFLGRGKPPE